MKMLMFFFLYMLVAGFFCNVQVHGQDQTDFISIDCGLDTGDSYDDEITRIRYAPDKDFVQTGINTNLSSDRLMSTTTEHQLKSLRYFPDGVRNCYQLQIRNRKNNSYLIRASFLYGNYDGKNNTPEFDLFLGVNKWTTVSFATAENVVTEEIIHVPTTDYVDVCLVNINSGIPFISALELRPLPDSTYKVEYDYLWLLKRTDFGTGDNKTVRYPNDAYDRMWRPPDIPRWSKISAAFRDPAVTESEYRLPKEVMWTAVTVTGNRTSFWFEWQPRNTTLCHVFVHFAEVVQTDQVREFDVRVNGDTVFDGPIRPLYHNSNTYSRFFNAAKINMTLTQTANSTLKPILNAVEVFMVGYFLQQPTDSKEVYAMRNIKSEYSINRISWQGDPCINPKWDGVGCEEKPFRITSLNLASSGLTGKILPPFGNLTYIEELDLSNNSLNGEVPKFLGDLQLLKKLNLTMNNLEGSVPSALIERNNSGQLSLYVDDNLCLSSSCKNKDQPIAPIVAPIVAVLVLLIVITILWKLKRKKQESGPSGSPTSILKKVEEIRLFNSNNPVYISGEEVSNLGLRNRQFSYSEVVKLTNNFQRVIGKGGFGTVYFGCLQDNTEVAIKMLSPSSIQGSKEFRAEAKLLMTVHQKNLTSLIGYCDEGTNMGLIYEYMVNGNLQWHLSDRNRNGLSWEERLRISVDAAQGLEYLHDGIKPPVVHRDVKTSNILLDENFNAKLADFGLSKPLPTTTGTGVTTEVCGTPGYLDPEYYTARRLTKKSDIYSFGVVLLEIITGQPAITRVDDENIHIAHWVRDMLARGDIQNIVDPCLQGAYDRNSAWKIVEIAMCCASTNANKRPIMSSIVMDLKDCLRMEMARVKSSETESEDSTRIFLSNIETGEGPSAR